MMKETPIEELSKHYYEAGRKEKYVCFSQVAGEKSIDENKPLEAKRHFQKVLDATEKGGYEEDRRYDIEGIADADVILGDLISAWERYDLLLNLPLSEGEKGRVLKKRKKI
jgi:hypothetical protein